MTATRSPQSTSTLPDHVLAHLQALHARYCDWQQREDPDVARMVELGHPCAAGYRQVRAVFDSLKYACNAGARWFSYEGEHEYAQLWTPRLSLSFEPRDLPGFGQVWPAMGQRWSDYIEAAAAAGFPAGCGPRVEGGTWAVETRAPALVKDLRLAFPCISPVTIKGATTFAIQFDQFLGGRILDILREHHGHCILPQREEEDDLQDRARLPMHQKTLLLGNVRTVTVTERHVLVPLVAAPLEPGQAQSHIDAITACLAEGLPFDQAHAWLAQFLNRPALERLQRQHPPVQEQRARERG